MSGDASMESERLREALLDLERTRARQKEALEVSAQLLRCLRVFDAPRSPDRIIPELLEELRAVLGFQEAFFLAPGEGDELRVTASTSPRFEGTRWRSGSLFRRAAAGGPVAVFDVGFVQEWQEQPAHVTEGVKSALHIGLRAAARPAFLVCTHGGVGFFADRHRQLAGQFAPLASQALDKLERTQELARVNAALKQEIAEREQAQRALEQAQRDLLATARRAGMAEVATNMLHNVGNVLNSILAAAATAKDRAKTLPVEHVTRAAELLATLAPRLAGDRRAELLPEFLSKVAAELARDREAILDELGGVASRLEHVATIVDMQQSLAGRAALVESVEPASVIEDALQINAAGLARHRVVIERDLAPVPPVRLDKHRLLQVLVNLVSNAKYALDGVPEPRRLVVRMRAEGDRLRIEVADNGIGIAPEDLQRVFQHGFTTRKGGHGYGLHSGALAIKQMGGHIDVESGGRGAGARFTIELPIAAPGLRGAEGAEGDR